MSNVRDDRLLRVQDVITAAALVGIRRNGQTTARFATRTIAAVLVKARISPRWSKEQSAVVAWAQTHADFDPEKSGVTIQKGRWDGQLAQDRELDQTLQYCPEELAGLSSYVDYQWSQVMSYLKERRDG